MERDGASGRSRARDRRDDDKVREAARLAIRRSLRDWHGKKPVTQVHLVRIAGGAA